MLSLQPGSAISRYRVISSLGSGGMGEVYLARDETLERTVALKVLPPELVKNEERVRRFVQEAKSASSLSHPHIVTIHEIGQAEVRPEGVPEGAPAGGVPIHFIAMELVRGSTFRDLIHREDADLRTLLHYLAQAAEGLAKAHAAGIVHRDLKPENIMVTRDGYAKVLDFGLAKLIEKQAPAAADSTSAPTATAQRTEEGVVLGTVGYMSPEQVLGRGVDHRSDIFSFGCILYEAATRQRPFSAGSDVETMHKILKEKPDPIEALNPQVPAEVRRVIRRCLAKSPDQRLQSMKDLAIELGEIVEEYENLSIASDSQGSGPRAGAAAISGSGPAAGAWSGLYWRTGVVAAAVTVGLAGLAVGVWGLLRRNEEARGAASSFQAMKITRLASIANLGSAVLSPDGRYLAFSQRKSGKSSVWVKQIATGSDIQILPPQEAGLGRITFSPDGNYLYYRIPDPHNSLFGVLYQVPALGGGPRKVISDLDHTPVTFSPDGRQITFGRTNPQTNEWALVVANVDGTGERRLVVKKAPDVPYESPSWSPDGARLAAVAFDPKQGFQNRLVAIAVSNGEETPIGAKRWDYISGLAWLPDGSGLALTCLDIGDSASQVWFVSYPGGKARKITNDVNDYYGISVSADSRTLATTQGRYASNLWVAPAGNTAAAKQITFGSSNEDAVWQIRAIPSRSILFSASKDGKGYIASIEADGTGRKRLTPDGTDCWSGYVARSAGLVLFSGLREDRIPHIWRMDLDGGNLTQVTSGAGESAEAVSPDGRTIILYKFEEPGIWKAPLAGASGQDLRADVRVHGVLPGRKVSPDGRLQGRRRPHPAKARSDPRGGRSAGPHDGDPRTFPEIQVGFFERRGDLPA